MSEVDDIAMGVLVRTRADPDMLRQVLDRLDAMLTSGPLERTLRLWDISQRQLARVFDVDSGAVGRWLVSGTPGPRRPTALALGAVTDLLAEDLGREQVAAAVRKPVEQLGGRTRLDTALEGDVQLLLDEVQHTHGPD